jgi:hypothetical protein
MPDRVWQRPTPARARDAGGSDGDFAGGVRVSVNGIAPPPKFHQGVGQRH